MKVKEIEKTVNLAWSPKSQYPILLAAGTAAQQLDASFSTSAALELYSINLGEPSLDLDLCCSSPTDYRFHKLVWETYGYGDELDKSVIVGGCDGGRILIYDAKKLLKNENGMVAYLDKHTGPVKALDFNFFQKNLLTSGASKSEIIVWDMNNLNKPMTPGATTQPAEDVISLSWNKQVQHILANTFATRCIVWDFRKNEPIIKLSDSSLKVRWKVVTWNPRVATQLCLASEEDQCPVIQLWDLRFASSPIKTFEGHQKGVLSASWCNEDPDLLISCGKDNKLLVWNVNSEVPTGEIVCDMHISTQWNFEVDWCPRNPFLVSTSSFDGCAAIYSLSGGKPLAQTSNKIADSFPGMTNYPQSYQPQQVHHQQHPVIELMKPPKWMKKPVGVSFAFGGKLVSFNALERTVYISQVVTEPDLMLQFKELLDAFEKNNVFDHCYKKMENSVDSKAKEIWNFIACQFYGESFKSQACSVLGASQTSLKEKLNYLNITADSLTENDTFSNDSVSNISKIGPADDTDILKSSVNHQTNKFIQSDLNAVNNFELLKKPLKIIEGNDINGAICDALLLDNKELAVDLCIKQNRMADAIILAMSGGPELVAKAQLKYFEKSDNYLTTLISAVVSEDWCNIVENSDISNWKQVLVALINHTKDDEFRALSELLGQRLLLEGDEINKKNALICYVCSGNVNQLLDNWKFHNPEFTSNIQELVELALVMKEAMKCRNVNVPVSGTFAKVLANYAELLASQGYLTAAYTYLGESIDEENIKMLKDRLAYVLNLSNPHTNKPEFSSIKSNNYFQLEDASNQVGYPTTFGSVPPPAAYNNNISKTVVKPSIKPAPLQPPSVNNTQAFIGSFNPPTFTPIQSVNNIYNSLQSPVVSQPSLSYANHVSSYSSTANLFPSSSRTTFALPPTPTNSVFSSQTASSSQLFNPTNSQFSQHNQLHPPTVLPPTSSVMARSTPTPPVPPLSSQIVYNNPRQTPDHVSGPTRSKYIVDPSVQGGGGGGGSGGYRGNFSTVTPITQQSMNLAQPFYTPNDLSFYQMPSQNSTYPSSQQNANMFIPNSNIPTSIMQPNIQALSQPSKSVQSVPITQSTSGWNDPPSFSLEKSVQKQVSSNNNNNNNNNNINNSSINPITHPLYGSASQENLPNKSYNATEVITKPVDNYPPPGLPNSYQNNVNQLRTSRVITSEPPKPKPALPEQHIHLQTVLEELRCQCVNKTANLLMKRKLEDVARKLEMLYDAIRENKLSQQTLSGLHEIVNAIQQGNYQACLSLHTQLASGTEFSTIASFMPGIKVLVQSALQLDVYV